MLCYCGSTKTYATCCEPFILENKSALLCEQLMRSRYSAYCHHDIAYIFKTYHPSKQQDNPHSALEHFAKSVHFIKLDVHEAKQTEQEGYVLFSVSYIQDNVLYQFTEKSRFVFDNRWFYIDGQLSDAPSIKLGRNDICPCGSGKKFKACSTHLPSH